MQKISNFFLINFLKQDVLYINQNNKFFSVNPIYFLINLKQIFRLKKFNLSVGVYISDKQCRSILNKFLNNSKIIILSDENFHLLKSNVSIIFFIQTSKFETKTFINNLNIQKKIFIKISNQTNKKIISEPFYSILLDNFNIKNIFFLVTFLRFFVKN